MRTSKFLQALVLGLVVGLGACHSIETRIEIDAPPARVWEKFSDYSAYGDWNPFMRRLEGSVAVGETIEVEIVPPGNDPMVFEPEILELETGRLLEWQGGVTGIFTGRHRFEFVPLEGGRTLFKHSEKFQGLLVPLFDFGPTHKGFEAMNRELKSISEKGGR